MLEPLTKAKGESIFGKKHQQLMLHGYFTGEERTYVRHKQRSFKNITNKRRNNALLSRAIVTKRKMNFPKS